MANYFSPLQSWLDGSHVLPKFLGRSPVIPSTGFGGFLGLERRVPVYESIDAAAEHLEASWDAADGYVSAARGLVVDNDELYAPDHESRHDILEKLGSPPRSCWPIYLISVGSGADERLVYVGKTSAKTPRFTAGHKAITKLHRPKYDGLDKWLYQGIVMLMRNKDYLPLEWVRPRDDALALLGSVEAQLIFHFQPELNDSLKARPTASQPMSLHIQNFVESDGLLNDCFVGP